MSGAGGRKPKLSAGGAPEPMPDDANARADRARDARDWPEAARNYRLALDWDPVNAGLWVQYGHSVKEMGNYLEAEAAYRQALTLAPAIADTHLQLGGLLMLRGRRTQALDCFRAALRLDPDLEPARRDLESALGYSPAEVAPTAGLEPLSLAERYGAAFMASSRRNGPGPDIVWLGVVDWNYRMQRPQHLARALAALGARVFYVSLAFETADVRGRFRILGSPSPGVFETRLRIMGDAGESVFRGLSVSATAELHEALRELIAVAGIGAPVVVVEHPGWYRLACGIAGATVVYDCLDHATGFSGAADWLGEAERALFADADLVITTSRLLADLVSRERASVIVRNGVDFEHFAAGFSERAAVGQPVIGYFGALADWFAFDWIEFCATRHPDWEFRLIGRSDAEDTRRLAALPNVRLLGELPYEALPAQMSGFDVAVIPFKLNELTRCTNPVKLYEYMAAGKAVVASPLPEIIEATELAYIAEDASSFAARIAQALAEDGPDLRARRRDWARAHTWAHRARAVAAAIDTAIPAVSVVIYAGESWSAATACLAAVRTWSDYPTLEIIVAGAASGDEARDLERRDTRLRILPPDGDGAGYSAACNTGLRAATGDYVVLLDADALVTRGWVRDLIRPLQLDPGIGLCGPLTNMDEGRQLASADYQSPGAMQDGPARFARTRPRRTIEADRLPFFCVALRRRVLAEAGLLDEAYRLGFFAGEDYCRRAREANYRLAIAEDVFVHRQGAASFDRLCAASPEEMRQDLAVFERRWGMWRLPAPAPR